jgi:predicted  nucleic acid-binding Zn-ribbon protein
MTLGDQVLEMEDDYERLKTDVRSMEEELNDLEQDLETKIQQLNELQAFRDWVEMAYPVVVKDYESVKLIEEVANGL